MRKKRKKKHYSIMIVPHENGNVRSFRISYLAVRLLLFAVFLLLVGAAVLIFNQNRLISMAMKASAYKHQNEELLRKNALILELSARVEQLEGLYQQLGIMLGTSVEFANPLGDEARAAAAAALLPSGTGSAAMEGKMIPGRFLAERPVDTEGSRPSSWPLTVRGYITRQFSMIADTHPGIDIAVPRDTPVKATGDGVVLEAQYDPVYGNYVLINHGNRLSTFYAHNSRLCVREGQRIKQDEVIAFSGSTGRSTAPHLHYELRRNNVPIDPQLFLR